MKAFYHGKRVLVTGHTGFKGAWLCRWLLDMGAKVWGYALPPEPERLYELLSWDGLVSCQADLRDVNTLADVVQQAAPQIVFHLAAQPLVAEGYQHPVETYDINVMGTVHLLDCLRKTEALRSVVVVTTDKVYANQEQTAGYEETAPLDGYDPYANSKSCQELVAGCWARCFFAKRAALSTLRAGNVIGGGDFAKHRILPDCIRAALAGTPILLRHPHGIRPYQHVLEPLSAYLWTAWKQWEEPTLAGCYNVAPRTDGIVTNGALATIFCRCWGDDSRWQAEERPDFPKETAVLRLNGVHICQKLGWSPRWNVERAVEETVAWTKIWQQQGDILEEMRREIAAYEKGEEQ